MDCVRHIRVRLRTAYINNFIPFRWKANQVPFTVCYKLLCVALIWFHFNVKSVTIVRPWTELHRAELKRNQNWDQVNDNRESLQAKRDRGQSGLRIHGNLPFFSEGRGIFWAEEGEEEIEKFHSTHETEHLLIPPFILCFTLVIAYSTQIVLTIFFNLKRPRETCILRPKILYIIFQS